MCGIVGVYNVDNASDVLIKMAQGIHHRGDGGVGMGLADGAKDFYIKRSMYNVEELVRELVEEDLSAYSSGVFHLRYGTSGLRRDINNVQPLGAKLPSTELCFGHNGDSQFFAQDKQELINQGRIFWTSSDSELILHYIYEGFAQGLDSIVAVREGLKKYRGTYAVVILIKDQSGVKLIAARDRYGNRPLKLGKLESGYVLASEDVAFEKVGAEFERDILNGELLVISSSGMHSERIYDQSELNQMFQCVYELIYFGGPTSEIFGIPVADFREELGRRSAKRFGHLIFPNDVVTYIPNSGKFYARGFCKSLRWDRDLEEIIQRDNSVRTFIQESQKIRDDTIRRKFSFMRHRIKRILMRNPFVRWVFIDDSVVRGSVARKIIRAFRGIAGKILNGLGYDHNPFIIWISAAPAILGPCHKGIDIPGEDGKLIAANHLASPLIPDTGAIAKEIGADALYYLPLQDLYDTIRHFRKDYKNFCFGCLKNEDPIWREW